MKPLGLIVVLAMSLVAASLAVAEPVSNNMAARIELHAINTTTLSDAQFLTAAQRALSHDKTIIAAQEREPNSGLFVLSGRFHGES